MNPMNDQPPAEAVEQEGGENAIGIEESQAKPDLAAQLEALAAEKADLYDRLLRRQAEFENLRRRSEREKQEISEFAAMSVLTAVLPVMDDFERALGVECADREYVKGVELIYQRLSEALQKLGLEPIAVEGRKFDPNLHHAVQTVETREVEDHSIVDELQKGYNFRGKMLRPAMVKVAVTPSTGNEQ